MICRKIQQTEFWWLTEILSSSPWLYRARARTQVATDHIPHILPPSRSETWFFWGDTSTLFSLLSSEENGLKLKYSGCNSPKLNSLGATPPWRPAIVQDGHTIQILSCQVCRLITVLRRTESWNLKPSEPAWSKSECQEPLWSFWIRRIWEKSVTTRYKQCCIGTLASNPQYRLSSVIGCNWLSPSIDSVYFRTVSRNSSARSDASSTTEINA